MSPPEKLSRKEKGKAIADVTWGGGDSASADGLDELSLVHRDELMDTTNMNLSQRLLVAVAKRLIRGEDDGNAPVDDLIDDSIGTGGSANRVDFYPTRLCPGGIFQRLEAVPPESLRPSRVEGQNWTNVFPTKSTMGSVKRLLRRCGNPGMMFLIPTVEQRPWSLPIGYQCVYKSYFEEDTKLWFPIPRLITSYVFCRNVAICQFMNGSYCVALTLMVLAAEANVSMGVRTFEELSFIKTMPGGLYSVMLRKNYNIVTWHPNKTANWQRNYFFIKSNEFSFAEPPNNEFQVLWN